MDKKRVLVVDDNEDILKILQVKIESEGHEFISAQDGEEMLKVLKAKEPDIVLLDIMLPKLDGYSALREMRKDDNFKDIPVIIISAKRKEEVGSLFALENIACFIEKPFKIDELIKKINSFLK